MCQKLNAASEKSNNMDQKRMKDVLGGSSSSSCCAVPGGEGESQDQKAERRERERERDRARLRGEGGRGKALIDYAQCLAKLLEGMHLLDRPWMLPNYIAHSRGPHNEFQICPTAALFVEPRIPAAFLCKSENLWVPVTSRKDGVKYMFSYPV